MMQQWKLKKFMRLYKNLYDTNIGEQVNFSVDLTEYLQNIDPIATISFFGGGTTMLFKDEYTTKKENQLIELMI